MPSHRPVFMATEHAVSAGHYLATAAGFEVLNQGGNAIDAGVAAGLAIGVVQSDFVNIAASHPRSSGSPGRARWCASTGSACGPRR